MRQGAWLHWAADVCWAGLPSCTFPAAIRRCTCALRTGSRGLYGGQVQPVRRPHTLLLLAAPLLIVVTGAILKLTESSQGTAEAKCSTLQVIVS